VKSPVITVHLQVLINTSDLRLGANRPLVQCPTPQRYGQSRAESARERFARLVKFHPLPLASLYLSPRHDVALFG
jgi:hypothetical protein